MIYNIYIYNIQYIYIYIYIYNITIAIVIWNTDIIWGFLSHGDAQKWMFYNGNPNMTWMVWRYPHCGKLPNGNVGCAWMYPKSTWVDRQFWWESMGFETTWLRTNQQNWWMGSTYPCHDPSTCFLAAEIWEYEPLTMKSSGIAQDQPRKGKGFKKHHMFEATNQIGIV